MECCDRGSQVAHRAGCARILQQPAEHLGLRKIGEGIADHQIPAQWFGAGAQHRQGLRMHLAVDEERFVLGLRRALGQRHRFRRRRGLVEQRGVGDIETGEIADHGLEIEQRLQPALADLRLIRRVGGVPGGIFQDVALDHRRQKGTGIALADQRGKHLVLRSQPSHMRQRFDLAKRRAEIERRLLPDRRRQRFSHQRLEVFGADGLQHRLDVAGRGPDVAPRKGGGGLTGVFAVRGHCHFLIITPCAPCRRPHPSARACFRRRSSI